MARDVLITPASGLVDFLDSSVSKASMTLGTDGILILTGGTNPIVFETSTSGSSILRADGTSGTVFEITDDLSDSLMSVNTIAGLPVFEVFADNHIVAGRYNQNDFYLNTNGDLGLGTSAPSYKLDIGGTVASTSNTIRLSQDNGGTAIRIGSDGGDVTLVRVDGNVPNDGSSDGGEMGFSVKYMGSRDGNLNALSVFTDNQNAASQIEAVTIVQDGKVGIGITEPLNPLDVVGYIKSSIGFKAGNYTTMLESGNESVFGNTAYYGVLFKTNNATRMKITNAGNVGIGTTDPQGKLDINTELTEPTHVYINGEVNQNKLLYFRHYANSEAAANNVALGYIGTNGIDNLLSLGHLNSSGTDVPIMHLTEAGNVGIGTTSPDAKLEVAGGPTGIMLSNLGDSSAYDGVNMTYSGYNSGTPEFIFQPTTTPGSGTVNSFFRFKNRSSVGSNIANVTVEGNVGIGTASPASKLHVHSTTGILHTGDDFYSWVLKYLSNQGSGSAVINYYLIAAKTQTNVRFNGVLKGARQVGTSATGSGGARITFYTNNAGTPLATGGLESWATDSYGHPIFTIVELTYNSVAYYALRISPSTSWSAGFAHVQFEGYANNVLFTNVGAGDVSNILGFSGSESVFSYQHGNLGIGTGSPDAKLHIKAPASSVPAEIRLEHNDGGTQTAKIVFDQSGQNKLVLSTQYQSSTDLNLIQFAPADNVAMTIRGGTGTSDGFVGIGTNAPSQKLHVNGTIKAGIAGDSSANAPALLVAATGTDPQQSAIAIQQGTNEGDTIIFADYEPYVEWGINTDNGSDTIEFTAGTSTNNLGSKTLYNNAGNARTAYKKHIFTLGNGNFAVGGNVGIGTTVPSKKLDVNGDVKITGDTLNAGFLQAYGSNYNVGNNNYGVFLGTYSGGTSISPGEIILSTQEKTGWNVDDGLGRIRFFLGDASGVGVRDVAKIEAVSETGNGSTSTTASGALTFYTSPFNSQVAERMRIKSDGNVGIGTATPGYKLEVSDDTDSTVNLLRLRNADATYSQVWDFQLDTNKDLTITGGSGVGGVKILPGNRGLQVIQTATGEAFRIDGASGGFAMIVEGGTSYKTRMRGGVTIGSGYGAVTPPTNGLIVEGSVGIGTTNPSQKLHVVGKALITDDVQLTGSNPRIDFNTNGSSSLRFYDTTNAAERMRINTSGNVGINAASPTSKLQIVGSASGDSVLKVDGTNGTLFEVVDDLSDSLMSVNDAAGLPVFEVFADNHIVAGRYNQNDFYLNTSGNLGLGTSSPITKLNIKGDQSANGQLYIEPTNDSEYAGLVIKTTRGADRAYGIFAGGTGTDDLNFRFRDATAGADRMVIDSSGKVGIDITDPQAQLHINGGDLDTRAYQQNSSTNSIYLNPTNGNAAGTSNTVGGGVIWKTWYNNYTKKSAGILAIGEGNYFRSGLAFYTNSNANQTTDWSEKMRIDKDGNVGIGTNTPASKLHVNGGSKYFGGGDWTTIERVTTTEANYALYVQTTGTNTNQGIAKFNYGSTAGDANTGTTVFTVNRGTSCFVGSLEIDGNEVWHAGNDGAGSGLDADLLDGCEGSHYRQCVVATNLGSGSDINSISDGYWKWGSNNPVNSPADYSFLLQVTDGGQPQQLVQSYNSSTADNVRLFGRRKTSGTWDASWTEYWSNANDGASSGLDADLLDAQHGAYYLDYNNFTNKPTIPTVNNSTINIVAGAGLATGGAFTTNQNVNEDITLDLEDTNVTAASYTSADITVDAKGRITAASSGAGGTDNYVDGISFNTNSNGILTLTRTGNLTDLTVDLDGRYCRSSGIISVASGNSNTLTVTTSSNAVSVTPKTQAVLNGGVQLSTSGSIYNFVTTQGYLLSCDMDITLGCVTDGAGINLSSGGTTCQVKIIGGTNVTVTRNSGSQMTICSSGGGTTYNNGDCITIDGSNNINHTTKTPINEGNLTCSDVITHIGTDNYGHVCLVKVCCGGSDYRMKDNINPYDAGYNIVKSVNTYKYVYKRDAEKKCKTGMMAHELQEAGLFHGAYGVKDAVNEDGSPRHQNVNYSELVPTLWSAVKESIRKIENLENKISELENCVNIIGQCVTE